MLGEHKDKKDPTITDNAAMVVRNQESPSTNGSRARRKTGQLWCDHCSKPRHTRDTC